MRLIIYSNENDLKKYNIKKDIVTFKAEIWKLYRLYTNVNPTFFSEILILRDDLKNNDFEMIFNMLNVNGNLIYLNSYNLDNFKNTIEITKNKKNNFIVAKKKINYVYNFSDTKWRHAVDFIIMGVQKCATTALASSISKHPDIYIDSNKDPTKSEIHYFDIYWQKGIEWYKSKFNYNKKIVGEKTPDLIYLPYTFPLIQMVNPCVKIILILRDPIIRAFSAWKMIKSTSSDNDINKKKSFEEEIKVELESKDKNKNKTFFTIYNDYLQRGLYYKQIKELLKWFPRNNILVLLTSDFENNPEIECNKIYNFLNLKEQKILTKNNKVFVSKNSTEIDIKLYKELIPYFKKDTEKLEKLLGIKTGWFEK